MTDSTTAIVCQKCGEVFTIGVAEAAMETDVICPQGHLTDPRAPDRSVRHGYSGAPLK